MTGTPKPDGTPVSRRTLLGRSLALRTFSMHTLDEWPAQRRALMQQAIALMSEGRIRLPETCANVTFCGPKRDWLWMCASQSVYLVRLGIQGAAPA